MKLKVKKLDSDARLPTLAYEDPAGYDLYANERKRVRLGEVAKVGTGIAVAIPEGYVGIIKERGSTPDDGIHIQAGVIDPDYRGEVKVVMSLNEKGMRWGAEIEKGDKIAQMVILKKYTPKVMEVDELGGTERGTKGWGSSDRT